MWLENVLGKNICKFFIGSHSLAPQTRVICCANWQQISSINQSIKQKCIKREIKPLADLAHVYSGTAPHAKDQGFDSRQPHNHRELWHSLVTLLLGEQEHGMDRGVKPCYSASELNSHWCRLHNHCALLYSREYGTAMTPWRLSISHCTGTMDICPFSKNKQLMKSKIAVNSIPSRGVSPYLTVSCMLATLETYKL